MVTETDLELRDGRSLHVYDASADGADAPLAVFWQHGTPNLGAPPQLLFPAAAEHGIRWVPMTGRATADRLLTPAETWRQRLLTCPALLMPWASGSSR